MSNERVRTLTGVHIFMTNGVATAAEASHYSGINDDGGKLILTTVESCPDVPIDQVGAADRAPIARALRDLADQMDAPPAPPVEPPASTPVEPAPPNADPEVDPPAESAPVSDNTARHEQPVEPTT